MERNWTEFLAKIKTLESLKRVTELLETSPQGIKLINVQLVPIYTGICGVKDYKILALSDGKLSKGLGRTFKDNPTVDNLKFMCELGGKSILTSITAVDGQKEVEINLTWVLESSITYRELYTAVWEVVSQLKVFGLPEVIFFGINLQGKNELPSYLGQFNRKLLKDKNNNLSKWDVDLACRIIWGENWFKSAYGKSIQKGKFFVECLSAVKSRNCYIDTKTSVIKLRTIILDESGLNTLLSKYDFNRFQHPLVPKWIPYQNATVVDENNVIFNMDINWELYEPALEALELMAKISEQNNIMSLVEGMYFK